MHGHWRLSFAIVDWEIGTNRALYIFEICFWAMCAVAGLLWRVCVTQVTAMEATDYRNCAAHVFQFSLFQEFSKFAQEYDTIRSNTIIEHLCSLKQRQRQRPIDLGLLRHLIRVMRRPDLKPNRHWQRHLEPNEQSNWLDLWTLRHSSYFWHLRTTIPMYDTEKKNGVQ